jgi:hypothetical protein
LNGIQEVSGSIPLGSTKFQDNIKNLVMVAPAGLRQFVGRCDGKSEQSPAAKNQFSAKIQRSPFKCCRPKK